MPLVSQAQRRWAYAKKDSGGPEGKAAAEFAASDTGGKLPERIGEGKSPAPKRSLSSLMKGSKK